MKKQKTATKDPAKEQKTLKDFVEERDWAGALTLLEFQKKIGADTEEGAKPESPLWLPYSAFHSGDYRKAAKLYRDLIAESKAPAEEPDVHLHTYLACCLFFLGSYKEAQEEAEKDTRGNAIPLHNRLLFHLAHKFNDEQKLMQHHQRLQDTVEDQLCLASIHCARSHYQEAIDVYKRFLLDHKDFLALNVYVALCYYKLDYFDVSHEVLNVYLQGQPDSPAAINLKACNHFKSYNGKAGETELKRLSDLISSTTASRGPATTTASTSAPPAAAGGQGAGQVSTASDLVRHNMVVFRNGDNALQVLPPLLGIVPEAQLNLVVYYLKNDDVDEAFQLIKDLEPATSQEYTLKGVVNAAYGQKHDSREHLKLAQQYFQLVGSSPTDCDTIPGRQCMASCFFLLKQFEDVLIYLNSIKSYFTNDDDFNWDYGIAKASQGDFRGGEEALLLVQNDQYKNDYCYISWLARCCSCFFSFLPHRLALNNEHSSRHHERESLSSVGAVPQDGDVSRLFQPPAADRQRFLQDGSILLLCKGIRRPRAPRLEPGILGREARCVRRGIPAGHRQRRDEGAPPRRRHDAEDLTVSG